MKYERIKEGIFLERPNRFIAYIDIDGKKETVHVKNTGRCKELLIPGTKVYVQEAANPERKTRWDLISVKKEERLINMDSQIPNYAVKEFLETGKLIPNIKTIHPEHTYGNSRIDLYVETTDDRKILIEVKGVTLENDDVVSFPDAPSERAVKHVEELQKALKDGYESMIFFVVQMKDVRYFVPNDATHPEFASALRIAKKAGVKVVAYDCQVTPTEMVIEEKVPVVLGREELFQMREPLVKWFRENKRDLPWRRNPGPYEVWVSEIMLQQTRVEAVKPYYKRFLEELPTVQDLAVAKEDVLLKLWEGLGYYNRVRNMQKAAVQIVNDFDGQFPADYEAICSLKGIGSYTAGAISAFAFGMAKPAVDGNVLRVISRLLGSEEDIAKASVKKKMEEALEEVIPEDAAGDFDQGLIELGALVCVPNGAPKCEVCPLAPLCSAYREGRQMELPVKAKKKERKIEERTVLIFRDGETTAIRKRPAKGLLAGLYEIPAVEGYLSMDEVKEYSKSIGLTPVRVQQLGDAKHIFSHIEWRMKGYLVKVDELEKACKEDFIFAESDEIEKQYPMPSAFAKYAEYLY